MESRSNLRTKAYLLGGVIGAVVGVVAANMLVKEAEDPDNETALSPARGFQIGMLVLGLLRQLTNL